MAALICSNTFVLSRANSLRSLLNLGHVLRLFKNPVVLSPATVIADLTEATFTGYAAINLIGDFGSPYFVKNGEYEFASSLQQFDWAGGASQVIYGWYIDNGSTLVMSGSFDSPITIGPSVPIQVQIFPQSWDLSSV